MANYYIYSPFSGQAISLNCYCSRRTYNPCNTTTCPQSGETQHPFCKDIAGINCTGCGTCFCSKCCQHIVTETGYKAPLDISASNNAWITAYMSANILSVKIFHMDDVCASETGEINQGVFLEAWTGSNATGKKLGRLLYGHVKNRQYNGQIVNKTCPFGCESLWFLSIGQIPAVPSGAGTCYKSTHIHLEIKEETGVVASRTNSFSCNQTLSAGVSPIYWWTY